MNIFITGASRGIGLATAQLLAQNGFHVWGTSRDISRLPSLPNFHPVKMDLNDEASIHTSFQNALKEAGTFYVLINNAGNGFFGPAENLPLEIWREQWQTLFLGPLQLIQLALPMMRAQKNGIILNVCSLSTIFPLPFMAPYNISKAAIHALTRTLRLEIQDSFIHIQEILPGDIHTPFHDAMRKLEKFSPAYSPFIANAFSVIEKNMRTAPPPEIVAQKILHMIRHPKQKTFLNVGDFFQSILAPLFFYFAPPSLKEYILKKYYRIN